MACSTSQRLTRMCTHVPKLSGRAGVETTSAHAQCAKQATGAMWACLGGTPADVYANMNINVNVNMKLTQN